MPSWTFASSADLKGSPSRPRIVMSLVVSRIHEGDGNPACNFRWTASYWSRRVPCTTLGTLPDPAEFRRSPVRRGLQQARSRSEIGAIYDLPGRRYRLRLIRGDRQDRLREHGTKVSTCVPRGGSSIGRRWPSSRLRANGRESLRWLGRVEPPDLVASVGHLYSSAIILGVSSTLVHVSRVNPFLPVATGS